jgi:SNF2 family DNA or RNA helicase
MPNFKDTRETLGKAESVASELSAAARLDASLATKTKTTLSAAKENQVLQKLAEIPIENLKDATESKVRVETLRKYGLTNVAAIYHSSESQLSRISGISDETASEIKKIATQMHEAIAESIAFGINIESISPDDLKLLDNVQELEGVRSKLRGNQEKLHPIAENLSSSVRTATPLRSRFKWIFSGGERRQKALEAYKEINQVLNDPSTSSLIVMAKDALRAHEQPRTIPPEQDFKNRASDYYSVLEDVSGIKPQIGHKHFNSELIEKIEAEFLDTGLINATLRKYQIFGSKFALAQNRVILGDEMGLGKTMQALGMLSQRAALGANKFLIVCPASVLVNWQREIESRSNLTFVKVHGEDQKISLMKWIQRGGIALTTFDTLKAFDLSDEEIELLAVDTVIVDEAHYVKNLETGRTKTISRWLTRAPRVLFMTGTPLENRVSEFVNLASLLDEEFAKNLNHAALAAGVDAFRKHVAPMYLRRNSSEVLKELPEMTEVNEYCTWNGADYEAYLKSVTGGNFMGMRKAGMKPIRDGVMPNKLERLIELTEEAFANGQKVIIFSYFRDVMKLVEGALGDRAMGPINGSVSPKRRQELVDQFTASAEPKALIGQIQAAGTGLNIQAASVIILCEPQIKPSLEVQAIARAHRMGQVRPVQVHRLIIPEGIDDLMMKMLARKQHEFDMYARESELANSASSAKDLGEESLAKVFVMEERKRLNLKAVSDEITIEDDE